MARAKFEAITELGNNEAMGVLRTEAKKAHYQLILRGPTTREHDVNEKNMVKLMRAFVRDKEWYLLGLLIHARSHNIEAFLSETFTTEWGTQATLLPYLIIHAVRSSYAFQCLRLLLNSMYPSQIVAHMSDCDEYARETCLHLASQSYEVLDMLLDCQVLPRCYTYLDGAGDSILEASVKNPRCLRELLEKWSEDDLLLILQGIDIDGDFRILRFLRAPARDVFLGYLEKKVDMLKVLLESQVGPLVKDAFAQREAESTFDLGLEGVSLPALMTNLLTEHTELLRRRELAATGI